MFPPDTCSPSRTDLMWPYSTWTGQCSTRYFLPFHLLLMSTKYQSINFVSLCDYTFWTRPYLGEKFVANWKREQIFNLNFKTLQDNIIPVCLPPGDISLSGKILRLHTLYLVNTLWYTSFQAFLFFLSWSFLSSFLLVNSTSPLHLYISVINR